jgi:hypothetical protein
MPVAPAPDKMKLHKWSGTKAETEIDRAGIKYFLSKPYRPDEVVRTLQSLIEGNHRST